jgi:hypothetical protein
MSIKFSVVATARPREKFSHNSILEDRCSPVGLLLVSSEKHFLDGLARPFFGFGDGQDHNHRDGVRANASAGSPENFVICFSSYRSWIFAPKSPLMMILTFLIWK